MAPANFCVDGAKRSGRPSWVFSCRFYLLHQGLSMSYALLHYSPAQPVPITGGNLRFLSPCRPIHGGLFRQVLVRHHPSIRIRISGQAWVSETSSYHHQLHPIVNHVIASLTRVRHTPLPTITVHHTPWHPFHSYHYPVCSHSNAVRRLGLAASNGTVIKTTPANLLPLCRDTCTLSALFRWHGWLSHLTAYMAAASWNFAICLISRNFRNLDDSTKSKSLFALQAGNHDTSRDYGFEPDNSLFLVILFLSSVFFSERLLFYGFYFGCIALRLVGQQLLSRFLRSLGGSHLLHIQLKTGEASRPLSGNLVNSLHFARRSQGDLSIWSWLVRIDTVENLLFYPFRSR